MAGIGFTLRRHTRRESLLTPLSAFGEGALVAAGPWMFTVLSIALIHKATALSLPQHESFHFRGHVIYAFALSLLATAPIVNVAVRQLADDIFLQRFDETRARFMTALVASAAASASVAVVVYGAVFGVPVIDFLIGTCAATIVGLVWPTLAYCSAMRDYSAINWGFALGLAAAVVATVVAALLALGPVAMMATFACGLGLTFFHLAWRILTRFPPSQTPLAKSFRDLGTGMKRYRLLALGSALAIAALWMDKWVMWFGPSGVPLPNGLISAPAYDGAMFVAYLTIIPGLGLFISMTEKRFLERYRAYFDAIREHGSLSRIEREGAAMEAVAMRLLLRVMTLQAIICAIVVMGAPAFVNLVGLQYQQIAMLRFGAVAALFQFQFLACTALLLYFEQHLRFFVLQGVFLLCQATFTFVSIRLGLEYYGYGHLVACAVSGCLAFTALDRTFAKLDFLTFAAALRNSAMQEPGAARPQPRPRPAPHPPEDFQPFKPRLDGGRQRPLLAP
jgi:polysaccharide biosynthesis protein PelG